MSLLKSKIKLQQAQESLSRALITPEQFEQIKAECEQPTQAASESVEPAAVQPVSSRPRRNKPAATKPDLPAAEPGGSDYADPKNPGND
ncbi:hypothetical protein GCM10028803_53420 [Larkinella knui]|uniref:Uncharacterized protein n=1 Tax=Larkinella knui TaxID=2025310 RepID=A0A3P1CGI1_9BACT|nr:hypothetical protein [Larkinella knui]RRB12451.1 hypothetical protein EHT87_19830 [Larkinella knui]